MATIDQDLLQIPPKPPDIQLHIQSQEAATLNTPIDTLNSPLCLSRINSWKIINQLIHEPHNILSLPMDIPDPESVGV